MRTGVIKADTIDVAVDKILVELGADTTSGRENAIYFDGWDGLGASAVLQAVAGRLTMSNELATKSTGLEFQKIIHIDCSKWESRRAMQRKIAEQLKLPTRVIDMFDKQDEEDDFSGLDQGSRGEIAQVTKAIYESLQNRRFLVILHNGSNEEIDILNFGLLLYGYANFFGNGYGYANSKMLWTFQGRFRLDPKMIDNVKKSTTTHVLLTASRHVQDPQDLWSYLVRHEAEQVSRNKHGHVIIDPEIAAECVLYMLKQSWIGSHIIDYNWAIHSSNYWICNGIIAPIDINQAWQVGNALQHEVLLSSDMDNRLNNDESRVMTFNSHLASSARRMPYWISTTTCGFVLSPSGAIAENMFQHSHRLGVLRLSRCTFSFSSPPFLCCHNLRFLWLEHCKDLLPRTSTADHHQREVDKDGHELDSSAKKSWECVRSLLVLDLRYTDWDQILSAEMMDLMTHLMELNVIGAKNWDMSHLRGRVHKIRKLRVAKSTCCFKYSVFSEMESMELLDFSGNTIRQGMTSLSGSASNISLKTVIVDGCGGLKMISFKGCKELKNVLLRGSLWSLDELDLSGTNVKTLDLGGAESTPKRIILLGCEQLCAILWPKSVKEMLPAVLQIDTISTSASTDIMEASHAYPHGDQSLQKQKEELFNGGCIWQISLTDARLLRSLPPVRSGAYLGLSGAISGGSNVQGTNSYKLVQVQPHASTIMDCEYRDVSKDGLVEVMMMWDCPRIPTWFDQSSSCIIKVIMHAQGNKLLEDAPIASTSALLLPDIISKETTSLHVYDNPAITSIPASNWTWLKWCRVERCPKIHTVFTLPHDNFVYRFERLQTFWASQLLSARYIWEHRPRMYKNNLKFLHLDHCPRLVHVLPFSRRHAKCTLSVKTIEILYCGDLKEVFPVHPKLEEQDEVTELPSLTGIHLHELPTLQRIYGHRMRAPRLETIKIRGCWSLRRLPAVGRNTKPPQVDCEKEWWDNLEWDGLEENHHPSLYLPSHSLYYKAQLPRVSVLR